MTLNIHLFICNLPKLSLRGWIQKDVQLLNMSLSTVKSLKECGTRVILPTAGHPQECEVGFL